MGCDSIILFVTVCILLILYCKHDMERRAIQREYDMKAHLQRNAATSAQLSDLKRTPNPRANPPSTEEVKPVEAPKPVERISNHYGSHMYGPKALQARYEDRVFSKTFSHNQNSSESRAKLLNSMYQELLQESVKQDPFLRTPEGSSCDTTKGRRNKIKTLDC